MKFWKIYCKDEEWPGLWRRFFLNQAVAVGFPAIRGNGYGVSWKLNGRSPDARWTRVRNCLKRIARGDRVVVQLEDHRIARIGEVVQLRVGDHEWDPLVPPSKQLRIGEMGRRICVRWEMVDAPADPDIVVALPANARFGPGKRRPTVCEVSRSKFRKIEDAIRDKNNWRALLPHRFRMESAISDYIGTYPHRLEDGLQPYLSLKDREHSFRDKTRPDILLQDGKGNPVVVECKQNTPSVQDIQQLRHYMREAQRVTGRPPRGMLVHGGTDHLLPKVRRYSRRPRGSRLSDIGLPSIFQMGYEARLGGAASDPDVMPTRRQG